MPKAVIATIALLLTGVVVAAWVGLEPRAPEGAPAAAAAAFDASAGVEQRLAALEAAVTAEREARQLLEDELLALYDEIEALEAGLGVDANAAGAATGGVDAVAAAPAIGSFRSRRDDPDERIRSYVEAGFSEARAEWLVRREGELRMEAMQAQYEAARDGEPGNRWQYFIDSDAQMRTELGEAEYEMYLAANGRPTAVNVAQVYDSSPGKAAGLQPGDRITHYDGTRIYSAWELSRQTLEGEAGESVVITVERDGNPIQLVVPRGPIGINSRGGR
ncbi:MAG: PDZ domain-containing protein [Woeseiaceae bacterium]|nr:PDZ domain-containing protein [Woeseiaceae bacterium]